MVELHGSVGELHHALTETCKALNADVTLGPLDLAYTEFQRVVQRAIFHVVAGESARGPAPHQIYWRPCREPLCSPCTF